MAFIRANIASGQLWVIPAVDLPYTVAWGASEVSSLNVHHHLSYDSR